MKKQENKEKQSKSKGNLKLYHSILFFLLALTSITVASYAWFSISANVNVHSMNLEITKGNPLKMDIDEHDSIEGYYQKLAGERVYERSGSEELYPVSSTDGVSFYNEDGTENTDTVKGYLEVLLHFRAGKEMNVHLSSQRLDNNEVGTRVSGTQGVEKAIRISFTVGNETKIYEPYGNSNGTFTLSINQVYNEENKLFFIEEDKDLPVIMRVWIEGEDPECTDELRKALYEIELYFIGTDEEYIPYR